MKDNNVIADKSKEFAVRIIKLYQYLCKEKQESFLSEQVLQSGTIIGAKVNEAVMAQNKAEFYSLLNLALEEASKTEYWLELLYECEYIDKNAFDSVYKDCQEILKLLMAITKTQKDNA